jgi:hypothetical protein
MPFATYFTDTSITATNGVDSTNGGATSALQLNAAYLKKRSINLTSAQIKGMYDTPVSILGGQGSGSVILMVQMFIKYIYGTTQYTGGGDIILQYAAPAHGTGAPATDIIANTALNDATSTSILYANGTMFSGLALSAFSNVAVTLSNKSAAFATGDGTFTLNMWYRVFTP